MPNGGTMNTVKPSEYISYEDDVPTRLLDVLDRLWMRVVMLEMRADGEPAAAINEFIASHYTPEPKDTGDALEPASDDPRVPEPIGKQRRVY